MFNEKNIFVHMPFKHSKSGRLTENINCKVVKSFKLCMKLFLILQRS